MISLTAIVVFPPHSFFSLRNTDKTLSTLLTLCLSCRKIRPECSGRKLYISSGVCYRLHKRWIGFIRNSRLSSKPSLDTITENNFQGFDLMSKRETFVTSQDTLHLFDRLLIARHIYSMKQQISFNRGHFDLYMSDFKRNRFTNILTEF